MPPIIRPFLSLFLFLCTFAAVFAVDGWFGSSFVRLGTGDVMKSSLQMTVVVGSGSSGFYVDIANPTSEALSLRLALVPQISSSDGLGKISCDMVNSGVFGSYFTGDYTAITLSPGETQRKRVDFSFPGCLSGVYAGCIVQSPLNDSSFGDVDLVLGKANFVSFSVSHGPSCIPFSLKVLPGSRTKGDYSNKGELRFYNINKQLVFSGMIQTNSLGTGILQEGISSGMYYVVYKGQSHLASYLSGVQVIDGQPLALDFTTGSNLYATENGGYQTAGDLKGSQGYDFTINGIDLSILISSGIIDQGVLVLDMKNLNGDSAINTADIGVLGNNFIRVDPFWSDEYHSGVNMFTW